MNSNYGWIISRDHLSEEFSNSDSEVGVMGPSNISNEMKDALTRGEGTLFRLYDDDRELYYTGRYIGDLVSDGGDPLTDFGAPNAGCTYMSEYIGGKWEITIG